MNHNENEKGEKDEDKELQVSKQQAADKKISDQKK